MPQQLDFADVVVKGQLNEAGVVDVEEFEAQSLRRG